MRRELEPCQPKTMRDEQHNPRAADEPTKLPMLLDLEQPLNKKKHTECKADN